MKCTPPFLRISGSAKDMPFSHSITKVRCLPFTLARASADRRKNAFTLLEMTLCLALMGIFASALTVCMHQIATFIGFASETARHCREFRAFCKILTADCEQLVFDRKRQTLEFQFPSQENKELYLTLFKRLATGWEHSFAAQGADNAVLCAIQYRFRAGVISRHLWDTQESLASFTGSPRRLETLSQYTAILSQNLLSNVYQFQLYPIDVLGRRQERWLPGVNVGLECLVIFRSRHRQLPTTFHARIPLPRMGHRNESPSFDNL